MPMPVAALSANCVCCGPPSVALSTAVTVLAGGMPVVTMGAQTAHGGVVVSPGNPMVLVMGMPIACITSMQVCPMVTGIVPHVGGPIVVPVPTVLA